MKSKGPCLTGNDKDRQRKYHHAVGYLFDEYRVQGVIYNTARDQPSQKQAPPGRTRANTTLIR